MIFFRTCLLRDLGLDFIVMFLILVIVLRLVIANSKVIINTDYIRYL